MAGAKSIDSPAKIRPAGPEWAGPETAPGGPQRARRGKIARLPRAVREELNQRLADGESSRDLLAWLNGLPEVQTVLVAEFAGRALQEQNLSHWRRGGFQDWERQQERLTLAQEWAESARELSAAAGETKLSAALNQVLLAQLGVALAAALAATDDPAAQFERLGEMAGILARLRREESNAEKTRMATEKWDQEVARQQERAARPTFANPQGALMMQKLYLDQHRPAAASTAAAA